MAKKWRKRKNEDRKMKKIEKIVYFAISVKNSRALGPEIAHVSLTWRDDSIPGFEITQLV